jgi:SAM-dependent methyltransferase
MEHLARPVDALLEAKRVLKPNGFIAVRSPDWGGLVLQPDTDKIKAALAARLKLQTRNGGDVYAGRKLGTWLKRAGFTSVAVTGEYEIYPDNDLIVDHLATQMEKDGQPKYAKIWRKWGKNPDAIFAQAWFAATGRKAAK